MITLHFLSVQNYRVRKQSAAVFRKVWAASFICQFKVRSSAFRRFARKPPEDGTPNFQKCQLLLYSYERRHLFIYHRMEKMAIINIADKKLRNEQPSDIEKCTNCSEILQCQTCGVSETPQVFQKIYERSHTIFGILHSPVDNSKECWNFVLALWPPGCVKTKFQHSFESVNYFWGKMKDTSKRFGKSFYRNKYGWSPFKLQITAPFISRLRSAKIIWV